ncbi:MAG: hypothetical protein RL015_2282 [Verrucomicrobiota bacterium]
MAGFELLEDFFGSRDDVFGEAGEAGDLDAVAFFGAAGEDLAEEDDLLVPLLHGNVVVLHSAAALRERGDLVVVGGEEAAGTDVIVQMLGDAPGDAEAVEGARAAADLIKDDEAALGGVVEDERGLVHLDHEGGLAARDVVASADTGEDAIHQSNLRADGGQEAANLRHEREQRGLAQVGALTGHVRPGDEDEAAFLGLQGDVVRHEALAAGEVLIEHGMAAITDEEVPRFVEDGTRVIEEPCGLGERAE